MHSETAGGQLALLTLISPLFGIYISLYYGFKDALMRSVCRVTATEVLSDRLFD